MKKIRILVLSLALMLFGALSVSASDLTVTVGGKTVVFPDAQPQIVEGRTMVPIRAVANMLACTTYWDNDTREAVVTKAEGDYQTVLFISPDTGEAKIEVSVRADAFSDFEVLYETVTHPDVPARILSDRVYVPLRFISENLSCTVGWDDATRTVSIVSSMPSGYHFVRHELTDNTQTRLMYAVSDPITGFVQKTQDGALYFIGMGGKLYRNDKVLLDTVKDFALADGVLYALQNDTLLRLRGDAFETVDTGVVELVQKTAPIVYAKRDAEKGSVLATDGYTFRFDRSVFVGADTHNAYYYKLAMSGFNIYCMLMYETIGTGASDVILPVQSTTAGLFGGSLYFSGYTQPGFYKLAAGSDAAYGLYTDKLTPVAVLSDDSVVVYDDLNTAVLKDAVLYPVGAGKASQVYEAGNTVYIVSNGVLYAYHKQDHAVASVASNVIYIVGEENGALILIQQ